MKCLHKHVNLVCVIGHNTLQHMHRVGVNVTVMLDTAKE